MRVAPGSGPGEARYHRRHMSNPILPPSRPLAALAPSRGVARSLKVQRYGLWLLVLGLLLVLWVGLFVSLNLQRQRLLEQGTQELALLNRAIAEQTAGLFKAVETALNVTDHWLQDFKGVDPVNNPRFVALVEHLRESSDGLFDLRVVSPTGEMRHVPNPTGRTLERVSGQDYVKIHLDRVSRALYIGEPALSSHSGKWELPVSWPTGGASAGVSILVAAVDVEMLALAYDPLRTQPDGTIVLLRRDDRVLSRAPFNREYLGRSLRANASLQMITENQVRATFTADSGSTDGVRRIASYERLERYPLTVLVSRGERGVLAPYTERRNTLVLACALLSAIVLLLTAVVDRAQGALQRTQERMHRLALVDELTHIMNRRAFIEQARREFARVLRGQRPCSVLVLDLDHFKQINDTHGHVVGDQVLRECCAAWRAVLRQQDLIGRMGGEEFCLMLPELDAAEAVLVAERLLRLTRELVFQGQSGGFHVTISIGVAARLDADTGWEPVYDRADKALYRAKAQGRDQLVAV